MEKYYEEFDDIDGENKLLYMVLFEDYTKILEDFIDGQLQNRLPGHDMEKFLQGKNSHCRIEFMEAMLFHYLPSNCRACAKKG